ncbi:MAG: endonuclease/exonuclease/phosphatase, partial [Cyanobacteriota bacterium]|nr:endonuclease/exonuclease/phosphatase [Cyanobacteriota bacterium]
MTTTLSAGDIAIIGVNTDNPDSFNFVPLTDINAGTEIFFTDNGVFSDGTFRANEGIVKYTAPSALSAGTVVEFTGISGDFTEEDAGFALSASGDQVIAYQGTSASPNFVYAVQTNSTEFQTTASSSNDSALPPGLTV